MNESLYDFCRRNGRSGLLDQWDTERNGADTPRTVSYGSQRKIWWRCEKGHTWQAPVYSRTGGAGCPYCTGRRVGQGNDLASLYPALAAQWDLRKNAPRKPSDVLAGSHSPAWWLCEKGHSWQTSVNSRLSGCGCPVCAGRLVVPGENSLADAAPELAAQWDTERNAPLTPRQVTAGTMRKVWWRCALGHSWRAAVFPRVQKGVGCPYCAGRKVLPGFNDLASKSPDVAAQWHPALNGSLTPEMVTVSSHRRVWWQCPQGHVWKALVYSRTGEQKCGCPVCGGSLDGARRARYEQSLRETAGDL